MQNFYLIQKGQAQKILSIEMSMVCLAPKMVEFALTWQQFEVTIFRHSAATLTNKMTDLLPFSTEYEKKPAKAYLSWNKISSFLARKPTCTSFFPCAALFALLQPQFIKMNRVLLKLPHQ